MINTIVNLKITKLRELSTLSVDREYLTVDYLDENGETTNRKTHPRGRPWRIQCQDRPLGGHSRRLAAHQADSSTLCRKGGLETTGRLSLEPLRLAISGTFGQSQQIIRSRRRGEHPPQHQPSQRRRTSHVERTAGQWSQGCGGQV